MSLWALGLMAGGSILGGFLRDQQSNRENRRNAQSMREQAGIYGAMAASQLRAARAYAAQGKAAASMGKLNAKNLRLAAAHLDRYEQEALSESVKAARERIGLGRTAFAANGVLVDSGSAARWEQDEAADAALERLDIMQQFEDQRWQYRTQANQALAEGYAAAAGHFAGAAGAAGDAYASRLQQAAAYSQAGRMGRTSWSNTIGSVLGVVSGIGMSRL